jgi:hypothetical protein
MIVSTTAYGQRDGYHLAASEQTVSSRIRFGRQSSQIERAYAKPNRGDMDRREGMPERGRTVWSLCTIAQAGLRYLMRTYHNPQVTSCAALPLRAGPEGRAGRSVFAPPRHDCLTAKIRLVAPYGA